MSVNALLRHCIQVPTAHFRMPSCVYSLLVHDKSLTLQLISKSQVYSELHRKTDYAVFSIIRTYRHLVHLQAHGIAST